MDENLHKDNLEEFFKNSFNDENVESSGDRWDVPSDEVWAGINESIQPATTPAPPFSFNLNWLLAAAASILILGLVYYNCTLQKEVNSLSEIIKNQDNKIQELEKLVLEKGIKNDIKSDLEKAKSTNQESSIETFSNLPLENNSSTTTKESSFRSNSGIASNQAPLQENNTAQNIKHKGNSVNNIKLPTSSADRLVTKNSFTEGNQAIEIASENKLAENQNTAIPNAEGSVLKQESQKEFYSNTTESKGNTLSLFTPIALKTVYVEANTTINDIKLEMLPISEEDLLPSSLSTVKKGFYFGAHFAPTYGYRNIKSVNGPILRRLLNEREQAIYSVSLGMKVGYQFSKNWSVETGLNYYKNTVESRHLAQLRYESQLERLNNDGNYDSNYQLKLATSYGEIETDVALTRSSNTQIDQNDYINLALKTRQELKNLAIPIAVRFRTAGHKFHFSAKAGISTNFILQKDVTVKAATVSRNGFQHRRTIIDKQFSGLKNTTFDVLFGIGLDYDISNHLSIYFEPTATHSINPVYNLNGKIKTYPIMASLNIGLAYRF